MLDQLIIGVISGVVATLCFSAFLMIIKPNVEVSPEICKDPNDDNVYRIKFVNKSKFVLNNLHYSLHYCEDAGDGIKEIQEIAPRRPRLSFISPYRRKGPDDYAIRVSYVIDPKQYPLDDAVLEFSIMASHSLSNTMKYIKTTYTAKDVKVGVFETGVSSRIIISGKNKKIPTKAQDLSAV